MQILIGDGHSLYIIKRFDFLLMKYKSFPEIDIQCVQWRHEILNFLIRGYLSKMQLEATKIPFEFFF